MSGLLLHLGGPLQSWGTHSTWTERDTENIPTRSALIGMIAAACGWPRSADLDRFRPLRFLVRIDRPGEHLVDFHTIGGGRTRTRTVPTAAGKYRQEGKGTLVTRRHYLTDAAFTVGITSADEELLSETERALRHPYWAPYLGRRACPTDGALLLATVHEPSEWLHHRLPLAREKRHGSDALTIEFVTDRIPPDHDGWTDDIADDPLSFSPDHRDYRGRPAYHYRRELPADLCAGYGAEYLDALAHALEVPT